MNNSSRMLIYIKAFFLFINIFFLHFIEINERQVFSLSFSFFKLDEAKK